MIACAWKTGLDWVVLGSIRDEPQGHGPTPLLVSAAHLSGFFVGVRDFADDSKILALKAGDVGRKAVRSSRSCTKRLVARSSATCEAASEAVAEHSFP